MSNTIHIPAYVKRDNQKYQETGIQLINKEVTDFGEIFKIWGFEFNLYDKDFFLYLHAPENDVYQTEFVRKSYKDIVESKKYAEQHTLETFDFPVEEWSWYRNEIKSKCREILRDIQIEREGILVWGE